MPPPATAIEHLYGSQTSLASYADEYDAANRLTVKTENGTPFTYATDQLTDEDGTAYSSDPNANRTMSGLIRLTWVPGGPVGRPAGSGHCGSGNTLATPGSNRADSRSA
jgi:hypothetical protein